MYLKSIEVHGFKSFANKILFDFNDGITGIVGPNGSGKSNVADAVRWVLGEQRAKQLRGTNMQDVIFAGTQSRKPLSYAYVSITLNNEDHKLAVDYDEVTVSRRVYRSGESEYLINGTPCRLKDVNELFYDTGIGKEGYSIIGQGQIDKILSGKPEDRRELFDEAAGIVKYKRRKNISIKKLEDARDNLARVNDILAEQERQLGPLEAQEKKAREYLKKKDELKKLDVNMFLLELDSIDRELEKVTKDEQIAKDDYEKTNEESENIKRTYAQIEDAISGLDTAISEAKESIQASKIKRERLESDVNLIAEQIKSLVSNEEDFKGRLKLLDERIEEKKADLAKANAKKEEIDGEAESVKKAESLAGERLKKVQDDITRYTDTIEEGKAQIIDLLEANATVKARIGHLDTMKQQLEIRRTKLQSRLIARQNEDESIRKDFEKLESEYENKKREMASLHEKKREIEETRNTQRQKLQQLDAENAKNKEVLMSKRARLESLKNIAERYEGYGSSIRRVMEKKDEISGIHGVIADLIKVDGRYETAIETALGGNIQNIVTEDEETAKKLVGFLKKNKFGRATFLPLTSVGKNVDAKAEKALGEDGVIGLANTLVEADERYDGVMRYLLGRVVVSENIDKAIALARKFNYSLHIVTVDGEYLSPGGSISGGAFKRDSNLLSRNRQITELEEAIAKLESEKKKTDNEIENLRTARDLLKDDLALADEKLHTEAINLNTLKINRDAAKEKIEGADAEFEAIKKENSDILAEMSKIAKDVQRIHDDEDNNKKRQDDIAVSNKELTKKVDDLAAEEEKISEEISKIRLELAGFDHKKAFEDENVHRIKGELEQLENDKARIISAREGSGKNIEEKEKRTAEIRQEIERTDSLIKELDEKLKRDTESRQEMAAGHKDFFNKRDEISNKLVALDKEIFRLSDRSTRLNERREYQINYMWEEYELTTHTAEKLKDESVTNLAKIKQDISGLKEEIRALGPVNVNAIEDFKELNERYEKGAEQRDDLVESEKVLIEIIDELDAGMRKQFAEKFAVIQTEFDKAFKELFGGGKGTLELIEDEDILESGIQITAQPPGKKLQNMMQLSGGEKALTAISLLFAIQNMKPSPFCLLDEIEAALDDSNVGRFADYLHKLTKNTQFIIITHRRGTMAAADRLYGITMQERGISTLVSVNLIEEDLDE